MAKYKVGDRVRVKADIEVRGGYYMEDHSAVNSVVDEMMEFAGQIVTISRVDTQYKIKEDPGFWNWTDDMFEGHADNHKIVITTDGKTTTARLFNGREMVKKAEAKCSPDDTFDFMVGAKLAMERLDPKPVNPFKVGDYVKITGDKTYCHCLPVGSVGRVKEVGEDDCYVDGFWNRGRRIEQHVGIEELEKI